MADDNGEWLIWGIPLITVGTYALICCCFFLLRKWVRGPMYKGTARMDGKTVVLTGGNTGIGKETARDLARRGAKVTILCRDMKKAQMAADDIKRTTGEDVSILECDLASFDSIRKCAEEIKEKMPKIHVLINNAGIMMCPYWKTKDGFEMQFGTNHLGHFLLTNLLLDNIKAAAPSRIVNVSSIAHDMKGAKIYWNDINFEKKYDPTNAYSQSKLANVLFTKSLAKKLKGEGVTAYSLHPGAINTDLGRHLEETAGKTLTTFFKFLGAAFFKDVTLGAQTTIYCSVEPSIAKETGLYYSDCKKKKPSKRALDEGDQEKLWKISVKMTKLGD